MPIVLLLVALPAWAQSTDAIRDTAPVAGAAEPSTDAAVYGEGIRSTPWLSGEQEQRGFHLPAGFEIRLFASEPQISKPLNMAFDQRGRLWMTQTVEYPYPAPDDEAARDAVMVLEDTDGDGAADEITTFADRLNIPIGVLPTSDGCLCFSIPNIWRLQDTDNDGRCDRRRVVLGPFDTTRDTHGMINSLRDGGDGWIYACHGFNNQSEIAGTDGHSVTLHSGNTFRFRPDGSRVEQVTHGQVNPFGMTEDEWGYRYTADCHSKPITQLIRGACYPSFGRPHDGLGFLPPMVDHLHGSTAISGILYIPPHSPIVPLRGQMISGNVMTSRLNRNQVTFQGATARGRELPDFLTSNDPWFRPVDIQLGPDGHIYVADFYNKIIGHYEVPLDHPERDRTSGRIWQIRYLDGEPKQQHPPLTFDSALRVFQASEEAPHRRVAALKLLASGNRLDDERITDSLMDSSEQVRVTAIRLASANLERDKEKIPAAGLCDLVRKLLEDPSAHVACASAELLGQHGGLDDVALLLDRLATVPDRDPVLRQTIRIAVRGLLRRAPSDAEIWSGAIDAPLASILLGLSRREASRLLLDYLSLNPHAPDREALLSHAVKHIDPDSVGDGVRVAKEIAVDDPAKQFELLEILCEATAARPDKVSTPLRQWALQLVDSELTVADTSRTLIGWSDDDGGVWPLESRRLAAGGETMLRSSLGRGERYTGRLVGDPFAAPGRITFWLAGHNGFPKDVDHGKNRIRLRSIETDEVLCEAMPPRNDVARQVEWDTTDVEGRPVRIECIDHDSGSAYAWIAFGRFMPSWILDASRASALKRALRLITRLGLEERRPDLESMLRHGGLSVRLRIDIARTLAALRGETSIGVVLQFLQRTRAPVELIDPAIDALLVQNSNSFLDVTQQLCKRLDARGQREFVGHWAQQGADMEMLLNMARWGWISREVFVDASTMQVISPRLDQAQRDQFKTLTKDIDVDSTRAAVLARLQQSVVDRPGDADRGQIVYTKHCAACHQLRGQGTVVGPQLDGAATRSVVRLLEDVVTPNRNVDRAFRTTSFLTDDGRVIVGLVTSQNDHEIVVVQSTGKPVTLDPESIEQRRESERSLMPDNMGDVLSADELSDLIRFIRRTPSGQ